MNWYKKAQTLDLVEEGDVPEVEEGYEVEPSPEIFLLYGHEWDVEYAKEILRDNPRQPVRFNPEAVRYLAKGISTYSDIMEFANPSHPVILITTNYGGELSHLPIDGWHRIKKALKQGIKALPAYVLTLEESQAIETGQIVSRN
jgi:hypothetical protein